MAMMAHRGGWPGCRLAVAALAALTVRTAMKLRDMPIPTVLGYELNRATLTPIRRAIDVNTLGDYGADPIGDGTFRMVPSGDVVDLTERNRRLTK